MKRALSVLCLALALFALAPPAHAQAPTAEARAAARELIEATNFADLMDQILVAMLPELIDIFAKDKPAERASIERAMRDVVLPAMRNERAAFIAGVEELYLRYFTAAELRDMTAFYRTPTGIKTLMVMPRLQAESMAMGAEWGRQSVTRALERNRDELRRRGINL
jgi:hypothetical protein